jgi:hypothetical protein
MARSATITRPKPPSPDDQITVTLSRRQILAIDAVFNNGLRLNEKFHLIGDTTQAERGMNIMRKAMAGEL